MTKTWLRKLFLGVALCYVLLFVGPRYMKFCIVHGKSMEPAMCDGSIGVLAMWHNEYKRGDVVVVRLHTETLIVKRIIGTPGDHVLIDNGVVWVNDERITEEYVKYNSLLESVDARLGDDEYFVMGDNRSDSLDSRYFGAVQRDDVLGKFMQVM